jgi:glycine/D-amino acid oxidase-like deaminating enzyme/nitrite reductase/ring-hydroxylating ferredoxin subunit
MMVRSDELPLVSDGFGRSFTAEPFARKTKPAPQNMNVPLTPAEKGSTSVWMGTSALPSFSTLTANQRADVCVVGAGIAGLTTAYLLGQAGKVVVLLDDGPIGSGETERTTAHLVAALDLRYFELERLHGARGAQLAAESHVTAINEIERIVRVEKIECDFERVDGYLFNPPGQSEPEGLDREFAAGRRAGLTDLEIVARAPLGSFDTGRALHFPRQAQFHPLKYLAALASAIVRDGGRIFTNTHATEITGGKSAQVKTEGGFVVDCEAIVVATNTPVNDLLAIHTKQAAYRSFVIGAAVPPGTVPKALCWDTADPYHYVRLQGATPGASPALHDVLIVGGEDHKTGQADDTETRYARLEEWARARFPMMGKVQFRWSGQVMEPHDGLAFIGRNPLDHDNIYVVTGHSGNGMTYGTIAGRLLTDLIQGQENPWAALYDPSRVTLAAVNIFAEETGNMAAQYADWLTEGDVKRDEDVLPGTGVVVRHGLTKVALYRDPKGGLHECSAICPHLGGIVRWNHAEKTWDCPCHGSRFDAFGQVISGPANKNLDPVAAHAH